MTDTTQGARHAVRRCRALYRPPDAWPTDPGRQTGRVGIDTQTTRRNKPARQANLGHGKKVPGAARCRAKLNRTKLKGGIRCLDAKPLHALRRAPLTPPEPIRPRALRSTQLRLSEPFVADTAPDPKTLCGERSSRSEDPSSWTLRRVRKPFVVNTPPDPRTLRCGRSAGSEDPLSRTLLEIREPFVAGAPPGPKTLCCARPSGSDDPSLRKMSIGIKPLRRNKKIHLKSNFLWIKC